MLIPLFHRLIRRHLLQQGVQSKRIEVPGSLLHYYEVTPPAPAETLVLVHGLGTSASTWIHVLPALGQRFRVLALDLPGFGFSERKNATSFRYLEEFVDTLSRFIDRTVSGHFILLGHSLGGWITMRYAVEHRERVQQLILINTAGVYYEGTEKQRELFDLKSLRDTRRLLDHIWLRYPWYLRPFNPWVFEDLVSRKVPEFVQAIREDDFMNSSLKRLTMPVNVIWGTNDRLISEETLSILQKSVPGLHVQRINHCGHVPQLERPVELLQALGNVVGRNDWNKKGG